MDTASCIFVVEGEAPQGAEGEHEGEEKQKKKKKVLSFW